jgi:hypothetical protein
MARSETVALFAIASSKAVAIKVVKNGLALRRHGQNPIAFRFCFSS